MFTLWYEVREFLILEDGQEFQDSDFDHAMTLVGPGPHTNRLTQPDGSSAKRAARQHWEQHGEDVRFGLAERAP